MKDWELGVYYHNTGIGGLGMDACKSKIEDLPVFNNWELYWAVIGRLGADTCKKYREFGCLGIEYLNI